MRAQGRILALAGFSAALFVAPVVAAEPHIGRWAIDPSACNSEGDTVATSPLVVTQTSLRWFTASCRIGKIYKVGDRLHIQARCSGEGSVSTVPITLKTYGDRMAVTWGQSPAEEMLRCR